MVPLHPPAFVKSIQHKHAHTQQLSLRQETTQTTEKILHIIKYQLQWDSFVHPAVNNQKP